MTRPDLARWRLLVLMLVLPQCAWAYVDPGTGMLLLQGLIAAIGALVVFVRNPVKTVKAWLARRRKSDERP